MQSSLTKNGTYLQRRKMFPLGKRHNLRSNAQYFWLGSLNNQAQPSIVNSKMEEKHEKELEKIKDRYGQYLEKQFSKNISTADQRDQTFSPKTNSECSSPSKKFNTIEIPMNYIDETLNKEIQSFSQNTSSAQRQQSKERTSLYFDPSEQKKKHLRSSLDKSLLIDSPDSALMPSSQKKYKQYDYDKLDRFLRANLKKSTRY